MIEGILLVYIFAAIITLAIGCVMYNSNKVFLSDHYDDIVYGDVKMYAKIGARLIFSCLLWPIIVPVATYHGIKYLIPIVVKLAKAAS